MGGISIPATATQIGLLPAQFFINNFVYTVTVTGYYKVCVFAPGGSGAAAYVLAAGCVATGAGGGSYSDKTLKLTAGQVLNGTVGVAGVGVVSSVSGVGVAGNAATQASVIDSGGGAVINLVCPGGSGGLFSFGAGTTPGGAGGLIATGGGACGSPLGIGGRGGHSTSTNTLGTATGGGAIGTHTGGDTAAAGAAATISSSGGTGTSASGVNGVTPGLNAIGIATVNSADGVNRSAGGFDFFIDSARCLTGGGATGAGGAGCGSGGVANAGGATSTSCGMGGGTGGAACSAQFATSGTPRMGGGSGGAASNTPGPSTSGDGGRGIIIIEQVG